MSIPRHLVFAVVVASGCAREPAPAPVVPPPPREPERTDVPAAATWASLRKAARDAARAKDYATFRSRLLELYAFSRSGRVGYEIAAAEALLGHTKDALARLDAFAAAGLSEDLEGEPAFASLAALPEFARVKSVVARNLTPVAGARVAFALPHDDLLTEDVAYDEATHTFFVSSVHRRKILALDESGTARTFVVTDAAGPGGLCGLAVHAGKLWATVAPLPPALATGPFLGAETSPPTAVLAFDGRTGGLLERIELPVDGAPHALTDLAIGPRGDVYASDAVGGDVYTIRSGAHRLEVVARRGLFVSPQTPAPTADGKLLYVPDYVRGIAEITLATGAVRWLEHGTDVALNGIDGLYLGSTKGHLVAVQNGTTPVRIVGLRLDAALARVEKVEVLERRTPGLGEPTHGVAVGGTFFFLANAGWDRFTDAGAVRSDAPPDAPRMMRLPLY